MKKLTTLLLLSACIPAMLQAQEDPLLLMIGLTEDQRLIEFDEEKPGDARDLGPIKGLRGADTAIADIDFRVQDGKLYGLGNGGGIYTIEPIGAKASLVNRLKVSLRGQEFGIDFNPAADRLRIVSNVGQNLRHNVETGETLADLTLNYTPGITATRVTGVAYTNDDLDPLTSTTLFGIDTRENQVVIVSPPNNGSLAATGSLLRSADRSVGFDIHSKLRSDLTVSLQAFATLPGGRNLVGLYTINLLSGKASLRDQFKRSDKVIGIAIYLNQL